MSAEKTLWAAVLIRALSDLLGVELLDKDDAHAELIRAQALSWFQSTNSSVGSLLWVCYQLQLSPTAVRRALTMSREDFIAGHRPGSEKVRHGKINGAALTGDTPIVSHAPPAVAVDCVA